jgi:acylphosphatase
MKAERLLISGRVQGVGYRDWLVAEATRRNIKGWVRNLGHDQVEALLHGEAEAIEEIVALCRQGPSYAQVTNIARAQAAPPAAERFQRLPSA